MNEVIYKITVDGKSTREYRIYRDILTRANDPKYHEKKPSYIGTTISDRWLDFQTFASDINNMIGFNEVDENGRVFSIDKDLLSKGGKVYSKETCCFVPYKINSFLANVQTKKNGLPPGVSYIKRDNIYRASIHIDGKSQNLGQSKETQKAYEIYCQARNERARELAEIYKNQIDPKAYRVLKEYSEVWFDVLRVPSV